MKNKIPFPGIIQIAIALSMIISGTNPCFPQGTNFPPGLNAYSVQMHIHGMSNHNGHPMPGSLQWHSFLADTSNTSVLWWSEHRSVFEQFVIAEFTFNNGVYDSVQDIITGLNGSGNSLPVAWQMQNNGGIKGIYFNDTTLSLSIQSTVPLATERYYSAHPLGSQTRLKNVNCFVRPLSSDPVFQFYLKPVHLNSSGNNKIQLTITLDYHHYNGMSGSQNIIYNFVAPPAVYSQQLTDSFTIKVNIPVIPDTINFISLDLLQNSNLLRDYMDNCTSDYLLAVYASQGDSVRAEFSKMEMHSTITSPLANYTAINNIAKSYVVPYSVGEYIGTEYSANGHEQHINAFIPDSLSDKNILYNDTIYTASEYISRVHSFNGAASYNHPFGLEVTINPAYTSAQLDSFALIYLSNKLFGADILEVGYVARAFDMQGHFSLWDKLTANQVFVYGNGSSDAHGGNWYIATNHWTTFIWASDSAGENLIAGMRTGKMFGADNLVYNGHFDFHVANAWMGDRVAADTSQAPVIIDMDNVLPGSVFKYTQGLIQNGLQVNYLHYNEVMDPANPPTVDLTQPCFIRIVVYDSNGKEYLFSNPVILSDSLILSASPETFEHNSSFKLNVTYNEDCGKNEAILSCDHSQKIALEAYEINGKLVCKKTDISVHAGKNNLTFACSNLRPGIYLLKAFNNSNVSGATFIVPPATSYVFKCND